MTPNFDSQDEVEMIHSCKTPLAIIRSHSEHLLDAYDRLSDQEALTLLKAIQSQTILLEHLLDEMIELSRTDPRRDP